MIKEEKSGGIEVSSSSAEELEKGLHARLGKLGNKKDTMKRESEDVAVLEGKKIKAEDFVETEDAILIENHAILELESTEEFEDQEESVVTDTLKGPAAPFVAPKPPVVPLQLANSPIASFGNTPKPTANPTPSVGTQAFSMQSGGMEATQQAAAAYYSYMYQAYARAYAPYLGQGGEVGETSGSVPVTSIASQGTVSPSRTIYLGNVPIDVTYEEILNTVRHGAVDSCRILVDKRCAFIDFVTEASATAYMTEATRHGGTLQLRKHTVRVAYAKPNVLPRAIQTAVATGASRVLYLAGLPDARLTEGALKDALSVHGPIELVKVLPDKKTAFVYFVSIRACLHAVQALTADLETWKGVRIGYGRDRCLRSSSSTSQMVTKVQAPISAKLGVILPNISNNPPPTIPQISIQNNPNTLSNVHSNTQFNASLQSITTSNPLAIASAQSAPLSIEALQTRIAELEHLVHNQASIIASQSAFIEVLFFVDLYFLLLIYFVRNRPIVFILIINV
jgi:hypothetical protein